MVLSTSISAKHNTLCPSILPLQSDISNTLPYNVWSDNERVLLSLADQLKNSQSKLKFPWKKNAHITNESRQFFTKINYKFCKYKPNRVSKDKVLAQLGSFYVRRDVGKSERVERQESLHTMVGPTGYLYSATCCNMIFKIHTCL